MTGPSALCSLARPAEGGHPQLGTFIPVRTKAPLRSRNNLEQSIGKTALKCWWKSLKCRRLTGKAARGGSRRTLRVRNAIQNRRVDPSTLDDYTNVRNLPSETLKTKIIDLENDQNKSKTINKQKIKRTKADRNYYHGPNCFIGTEIILTNLDLRNWALRSVKRATSCKLLEKSIDSVTGCPSVVTLDGFVRAGVRAAGPLLGYGEQVNKSLFVII